MQTQNTRIYYTPLRINDKTFTQKYVRYYFYLKIGYLFEKRNHPDKTEG